MSEQVSKSFEATFLVPSVMGGKAIQSGRVVHESDYDALHAEAEALHRQVTELTSQRDAILLQARCWAGEAKAQQAITKAVGEALGGVPDWGPIAAGVEALRIKLEAARGLLREMDEYLSRRGDGEAIHTGSKFHMAIDAFLTTTTAPEVRLGGIPVVVDESVPPGEMRLVGPGGQVMARVHHNSEHAEPVRAVLNSIGRQLPDNAPLYAVPQPGPDVRALVEALEWIARVNACDYEYPEMARKALAKYRQAQQGEQP